jgi:hypothetical protein
MKSFKEYLTESVSSSRKRQFDKAVSKIMSNLDDVVEWERQANQLDNAVEMLKAAGFKISDKDKDYEYFMDEFYEEMQNELEKHM